MLISMRTLLVCKREELIKMYGYHTHLLDDLTVEWNSLLWLLIPIMIIVIILLLINARRHTSTRQQLW